MVPCTGAAMTGAGGWIGWADPLVWGGTGKGGGTSRSSARARGGVAYPARKAAPRSQAAIPRGRSGHCMVEILQVRRAVKTTPPLTPPRNGEGSQKVLLPLSASGRGLGGGGWGEGFALRTVN